MAAVTVGGEQLLFVRQLVQRKTAIVLGEDKGYLVDSRLSSLARDLGHADATTMLDHLRKKPDLALEQRVLEAMTTNETLWFRDRAPFEALRQHVLPELARSGAGSRQLRIWSAACSSGQEIYSIAVLLEEHFADRFAGWKIDLAGTDFSVEMVKRASEGLYSTLEVNRGLPAASLVRHFDREGANWRLKPSIRSRARFWRMNLVEPWAPMPAWDIVLLRNVLIYFDIPTKEKVLRAASRQMAPGGYLLLGGAETAVGICPELVPEKIGDATFYRLEGREQ
ncbi:MAG: CheR family methyltransferase [Acidimicrobiales bacterium]